MFHSFCLCRTNDMAQVNLTIVNVLRTACFLSLNDAKVKERRWIDISKRFTLLESFDDNVNDSRPLESAVHPWIT
jgi:hypothetical protein